MTPADATAALLKYTYEALAHLGPQWSALAAGFAAMDWRGRIYITPAGLRYLETSYIALKQAEDEQHHGAVN